MRIFISIAWVISFLSFSASAGTIRVGVAISLKEAMDEIVTKYEGQSSDKIEWTFGSSGQLAGQIKNGAPIDVFISAGEQPVADLLKLNLLDNDSRTVVAGNSVVLIVSHDAADKIKSFADLKNPTTKKVAIGEPKTVPAGGYAMQVLKSLKLAEALQDRLVFGTNVRQVLSYVERGEVSAGLVYATDAKQSGPKVIVIATAPDSTHDPVLYPALIVKSSRDRDTAQRFLDYLGKDDAGVIFAAKGFTRPTSEKK